jgi:micrococcal nuclease
MYTYNCKIGRVVDGDTVDVMIDLGFDIWTKQRVRLLGIDAAETRTRDAEEKRMGLEAKEWLADRLGAEAVLMTEYDSRGKYGRVLGTFYKDDVNINQEMVDQGMAEVYE